MQSNLPHITHNHKKPLVILFDVNETMMDMTPLKNKINALLGKEDGFRIWFGMLLQYSLVDNSTGVYHDFSAIANATLDMAAQSLGVTLQEADKTEALVVIKQLKAYPDVEKGLLLLKAAGYRLATLTNSPMQTQLAQLNSAGIAKYFEQTLSVDAVKMYKPAPQTYQYAARMLGVETSDMLMVAAHGWDLSGAAQGGMQTAFIEREGQTLYPLSPKPNYSAKDFEQFAHTVLKQFNSK